MKDLNRKWEIYVIQHTHTDIGYTERQEVIEAFQIDYIKQAIEISEAIHEGDKKEWEGFRWTCETFWAVEKFLEEASDVLKERFVKAVKRGHIEITGNYLNLNEIIDADVLKNVSKRSTEYAKSIGIDMDCAMTADINGYSWGYAGCLYDIGIKNLFSCLHTHHGMFVGGLKQRPFYWETPNKDKVLVWMGEHYMLGNELGIVPGALGKYMIQDEFECGNNSEERYEIGKVRIKRYLENLENEDYPYDFVPAMVSGLPTDNAPPNPLIMEHINRWNKEFGDYVTIKMVSLDEFFKKLRSCHHDIPVYRGDWPDWWAEGMGSTPLSLKMFREAQRTLSITKMLDGDGTLGNKELVKKAEDLMMVYAEHTWGYSASVSEPWTKMVHTTDYRKLGYANNAHEAVFRNYDKVLRNKGSVLLYQGRPLKYKVINPFEQPIKELVRLYVDFWEVGLFENGLEVIDEHTGEVIKHQRDQVARGTEIVVELNLEKKEERTLVIRPCHEKLEVTAESFQDKGSELVRDIYYKGRNDKEIIVSEYGIETPLFKISWEEKEGIVSWFDKNKKIDLIRTDRKYNAFTPIYEVTEAGMSSAAQCNARRSMGRNRKGIHVDRAIGKFSGVRSTVVGELFAKIELGYDIKGTSYFSLFLIVYKNQPRVDVAVRLNKDNVWSPENLYVALPFGINDNEDCELWVEKTGAILRPRVDQLPGSNTDFYCIQEGLGLTNNKSGIAIGMPDTPLIQLGSLKHKPVRLHHENEPLEDGQHIYSWLMNNYWETNFKATLGEFYEFDYKIAWGDDFDSSEKLINKCHTMNAGIVCFRVN